MVRLIGLANPPRILPGNFARSLPPGHSSPHLLPADQRSNISPDISAPHDHEWLVRAYAYIPWWRLNALNITVKSPSQLFRELITWHCIFNIGPSQSLTQNNFCACASIESICIMKKLLPSINTIEIKGRPTPDKYQHIARSAQALPSFSLLPHSKNVKWMAQFN